MLVAAKVGLDARSTMDLDATVKGVNVNVDDVSDLSSPQAVFSCGGRLRN